MLKKKYRALNELTVKPFKTVCGGNFRAGARDV